MKMFKKLMMLCVAAMAAMGAWAFDYTVYLPVTNLGKISLPSTIKGSISSVADKKVITFEPYWSGSYWINIYPYTGPNTIYSVKITEDSLGCETYIMSSGWLYNFVGGNKYTIEVLSYYCPVESEFLIDIGFSSSENIWVKFDGNGGISSESMQYYTVGSSYISLPEAEWSGHSFDGWYTARMGGEKITSLSTVCLGYDTLYAHWDNIDLLYLIVAFDANGGIGTMTPQIFLNGIAQPLNANQFIRSGYEFVGWADTPMGNALYMNCESVAPALVETGTTVTLYAKWHPLTNENKTYIVTFDANCLEVLPSSRSVAFGRIVGDLPLPVRSGYTLRGWYTAIDGGVKIAASTIVTDNVTYYAHWTQNEDSDATSPPSTSDDAVMVVPDAASVYDGYLMNGSVVAGTVQVKVAKPKKGEAKVTATLQIVGEKKLSIKGQMNAATGAFTGEAKDGRILSLTFDMAKVEGSFGSYEISGVRNLFSSKDKQETKSADEMLAPWLGALNMITDSGTLSVTVAKKGKVTVKGTVDGAKVSVKAQALIGEDAILIPVIYSKKTTNLAFTIWLPLDGGEAKVIGMDGAQIGKAGVLKDDARFSIDDAILSDINGVVAYDGKPILPEGESVTVSGNKWIVADGAKAAKVAYKKGVLSITPGKKGGEIANVSGLKLSYKAKDGSFTGSFTVYALENGKLKKHKASVSGVLVNGVGRGTATIKKLGSWTVEIR